MSIELKKIEAGSKDVSFLRKVYLNAFPREERIPYGILLRRARKGKGDFFGVYAEQQCVGMAYVVADESIAYLFYFAMAETERGKGYGSSTIRALIDCYAGKRFFLALEAPDLAAANNEQRIRRHAFYEGCGLSDMPCRIQEASVIYGSMGTGGPVEPEEYKRLLRSYAGTLATRFVPLRMLPPK